MNELVARLSQGSHRIAASRSADAAALKEQIDRGYVLLEFVDTRGGTELGCRLDPQRCRMQDARFDAGTGTAHLIGTLTLDSVPVVMVAEIDLATLTGSGHLEVLRAGHAVADAE